MSCRWTKEVQIKTTFKCDGCHVRRDVSLLNVNNYKIMLPSFHGLEFSRYIPVERYIETHFCSTTCEDKAYKYILDQFKSAFIDILQETQIDRRTHADLLRKVLGIRGTQIASRSHMITRYNSSFYAVNPFAAVKSIYT